MITTLVDMIQEISSDPVALAMESILLISMLLTMAFAYTIGYQSGKAKNNK